MASSAVGIDIGTQTITVAEVKMVRGTPTITNFGGVELPPGAVREGEVLDVGVVAETLEDLLGSTNIKTKKVHLGVANQRVVVRQIDVPWVEEKELKQSLLYQVQEHLPIPVEEAELDSHIVDEFTTEAGERRQRLLLVAGHRDMLAGHVAVAEQAGLKPLGVDLNPFAILRSVATAASFEHDSEVVIDVGAGVTEIVVHHAGTPTFVRILALGGDDITAALASGTGVSHAEAESVKRRLGIGWADGEVSSTIVQERARAFVDAIRSSLDYHQAQPDATRPANVVMTGGGAMLEGLADLLATTVRLPVAVGSVFDRMPVKGTVYGPEELAQVGPNLAVAVGLALGGLE